MNRIYIGNNCLILNDLYHLLCSRLWNNKYIDDENIHYYYANIKLFEDISKEIMNFLPKYFFNNLFGDNMDICFKNYFISLYNEYGLLIITDVINKKISIGIKQNLLCDKNFYMIYKQIINHFIKIIEIDNLCIHAACIEVNNKNLLIIGESGSGKSSLLYHFLRMNKVRATIISEDLCVINPHTNYLSGYCDSINLRNDFCDKFSIDEIKTIDISPGRKKAIRIEPTLKLNVRNLDILYLEKGTKKEIIKINKKNMLLYYLKANKEKESEWKRNPLLMNRFNNFIESSINNCYKLTFNTSIDEIMKVLNMKEGD